MGWCEKNWVGQFCLRFSSVRYHRKENFDLVMNCLIFFWRGWLACCILGSRYGTVRLRENIKESKKEVDNNTTIFF